VSYLGIVTFNFRAERWEEVSCFGSYHSPLWDRLPLGVSYGGRGTASKPAVGPGVAMSLGLIKPLGSCVGLAVLRDAVPLPERGVGGFSPRPQSYHKGVWWTCKNKREKNPG
jgi:hypothetical protein